MNQQEQRREAIRQQVTLIGYRYKTHKAALRFLEKLSRLKGDHAAADQYLLEQLEIEACQ